MITIFACKIRNMSKVEEYAALIPRIQSVLSGETDEIARMSNIAALIIGTNLGGLGTLIASMASLISYRQIAQELPQQKGRYFVQFTVSNLVFLAILMAAWLIFG